MWLPQRKVSSCSKGKDIIFVVPVRPMRSAGSPSSKVQGLCVHLPPLLRKLKARTRKRKVSARKSSAARKSRGRKHGRMIVVGSRNKMAPSSAVRATQGSFDRMECSHGQVSVRRGTIIRASPSTGADTCARIHGTPLSGACLRLRTKTSNMLLLKTSLIKYEEFP